MKYILIVLLICGALSLNSALADTFQSVNVRDFATGEMVRGGATLLREDDSIQLQVALMDLDKKSVYTIWYIIFDTSLCQNPSFGGLCGEADFPAAAIGVINATGFVTGTDGTANADAELDSGPPPAGKCCFGELADSLANEVHIVVQTHKFTAPGDFATELTLPIGEADQFFAVFPPAP